MLGLPTAPDPLSVTKLNRPMLSSITNVNGLYGSVQIGPIGVGSGAMPGALHMITNGTETGETGLVLVTCRTSSEAARVSVILRANSEALTGVGLPGVLAVTVIAPPAVVSAVTEVWARPLPSAITGLVVDNDPGPDTAKLTVPPGSGPPSGSLTWTTTGCGNGSPAGPA